MFLGLIIGNNLHLCDLSALVVASENSESVLEADLQGNKECHSLDRVVTTINVVTHEQVVRIRWLSTNLEQLSKVMELSVDVSADCDGRTYLLDIRFVNKDFFCLNQIQKLNSCSKLSRFGQISKESPSFQKAQLYE